MQTKPEFHNATVAVTELPGLPGEPPYPVQIALPGISTFREGYVLRFEPENGESWVGNFQTGISCYSAFHELQTGRVAVIAGGQGYVVDVYRKELLFAFGGDVMCLLPIEGSTDFLTIGNIDIERHSSTQLVWSSARLAWDGIGRLELEGGALLGQARHFDDTWHSFRVGLVTGWHTGGAYPEA